MPLAFTSRWASLPLLWLTTAPFVAQANAGLSAVDGSASLSVWQWAGWLLLLVLIFSVARLSTLLWELLRRKSSSAVEHEPQTPNVRATPHPALERLRLTDEHLLASIREKTSNYTDPLDNGSNSDPTPLIEEVDDIALEALLHARFGRPDDGLKLLLQHRDKIHHEHYENTINELLSYHQRGAKQPAPSANDDGQATPDTKREYLFPREKEL